MGRPAKLTTIEKYAIQGMLHDKKTLEEIAESVERPVNTVKKYVEGELNDLYETIVKVQIEKNISEDINEDKNIQETQIKVNSKQLFARTSKGGNKSGSTIMTEAASMRGDSSKKPSARINTRGDKTIYRLSDGKILEKGDKINID